ISILTGAVILYDYGLAWAGTAAVMIGWPLITVFVLAIAASMAELASAYPTAGGLYYWASKMKNKNWGWWTAWLNLIGQFAIVAGKPDASGLNLFQIQPLDQGGSWNNNLGFINLQYGPATSYPVILAFFFSLLLANWTYTGYDASAHVAEETVGARMASAWGV